MFWWKKHRVSNGQNVSFKEPWVNARKHPAFRQSNPIGAAMTLGCWREGKPKASEHLMLTQDLSRTRPIIRGVFPPKVVRIQPLKGDTPPINQPRVLLRSGVNINLNRTIRWFRAKAKATGKSIGEAPARSPTPGRSHGRSRRNAPP